MMFHTCEFVVLYT